VGPLASCQDATPLKIHGPAALGTDIFSGSTSAKHFIGAADETNNGQQMQQQTTDQSRVL